MQKARFITLGLMLLCFTCLQGQTPSPPSPLDLDPGWWNRYFKEIPQEKLPDHATVFLQSLQSVAKQQPEEVQNKLSSLISHIETQLANYLSMQAELPSPPPAARILKTTYSLKELTSLYQETLGHEIQIRQITRAQREKEQLLVGLRDRRQNLRKEYEGAPDLSFERLYLGFQIIDLALLFAIEEVNLERLTKELIREKIQLRQVSSELTVAKDRLSVTEEEKDHLEADVRTAKEAWEGAKEKLAQVEAQSTAGEEGKFLPSQRLMQERLNETEKHLLFIEKELSVDLAQLLTQSESVDTKQLSQTIAERKATLETTTENLKRWREQIGMMEKQAAEQLSITTDFRDPIEEAITIAQQNRLTLARIATEADYSFFLLNLIDRLNRNLISGPLYWLSEIEKFASSIIQKIVDSSTFHLFAIGDRSITTLNLLQFFLVIFVTVALSHLVRKGFDKLLRERKGVRKVMLVRFDRLVHYLLLAIGAIIALTMIGFDMTNIFLMAGALGVGIGFGLQSIFQNFISGMIVLFQNQLRIGDYIEMGGTGLRGEIKEINFGSTIISTNDGLEVIVPSSQLLSDKVVNWTLHHPYRRVHIPFATPYGVDKERIADLVVDTAKSVSCTLLKAGIAEPKVYLKNFGSDGLEFELVVWVDAKSTRRRRKTLSQYLWALESALRTEGISIPYPQRDIRIVSAFGEERIDALLPDTKVTE